MTIFSVLVAVSLMALGAVVAVDGIEHVERALVVGGSTTEIGSKLFTSGIRHESGGKSYCGGVLVSPIHVLTTVQCVLDGDVYTAPVDTSTWKSKFVAIGTHYLNGTIDGEEIKVVSAQNHTLWNYETRAYNFAILTLEKASKFTPIKLAKADDSDFVAGMSATALGWGITEAGTQSYELQSIVLQVWDTDTCLPSSRFGRTTLCAGTGVEGRDTCVGDNGGPLIKENGLGDFDDVLIGLTAWGTGCGNGVAPTGYSRVSAAIEWINSYSMTKNSAHVS